MIEPGMDEISHTIMIKASKKKKKKKNIFDPQTKRKKEIPRPKKLYLRHVVVPEREHEPARQEK